MSVSSNARTRHERRRAVGPPVPKVRPIGSCTVSKRAPIISRMSDRGLHRIEDDLSETWIEDWAGAGVAELEDYLAKHAAFRSFLEQQDV